MLIIACGNRQRSDDGAGLLVAECLRELGIEADSRSGDGADLIGAWKDAEDVIIVDAVVTGAPVGTVQAWEGERLLSSCGTITSTHGFSALEAIQLARALNRLPMRLRVYGIEGQCFEPGGEVSPEVQSAVGEVVQRIIAEVSAPAANK